MLVAILGALGLWRWHAVTRPDYLLQRGQAAVRDGLAEAAWEWLDALEAGHHKDHALLLRGEILFQSRDVAGALNRFSEVSESSPLHVDAVAWSGRCFLQFGMLAEAETAYQHVLARRPDFVDAHRGLAAVYYDMGGYPLAAAHCREWARLQPGAGAPYRFRGAMFKNVHQFEEAVTEFREALSRELPPPLRAEVILELTESLIKLHRFDEALRELDSLSPQADAAQALEFRAEALRGVNRGDEAAALLDRALEREPDNVAALRLRGTLYLDQGQPDRAAGLLENAAARAPHDYRVHVQLAAAYSAIGKSEAARIQREKAKHIEAAMLGLADITRKLHDQPRNALLHDRMAALYADLHMTKHAAKARRLADMFRDVKDHLQQKNP